MTDPIVLAKALAAAKVNVKGTGQAPRPAPSAAEEADRTPNWKKWRLIPYANEVQCAALWANIDPDKLRHGRYGGFDESQDFKDRLDLVEANLSGALRKKGRSYGEVNLRRFAAWAREAQKEGWKAPAALLAMADEQVASAEEQPAGPPADAQSPQRRLRNKPKTLARNEGWQARINDHARSSTGKSHAHYCRLVAKEPENKGISPRTIQRVTKSPPRS